MSDQLSTHLAPDQVLPLTLLASSLLSYQWPVLSSHFFLQADERKDHFLRACCLSAVEQSNRSQWPHRTASYHEELSFVSH